MMMMMINKVDPWYKLGNYLIKKNNTTFGDHGPVIKVEHHRGLSARHVINKYFVLDKKNIKVIPEISANKVLKFWEKCNQIESFVPIDNRHPCYREDNITRKFKIKDEDRQNALFRMIKKTGDLTFQIYKCPDCNEFHMGRNPYLLKNTLVSNSRNNQNT